MMTPDREYIDWLVERSMLHDARQRAANYSGQGRLWQRPFAETRPRDAAALASVWFTAYPEAIITQPGESILQALSDEALWDILTAIGIRGVHTGPTKQAGGLRQREYTPTIDGNFDRIGFGIDAAFGTQDELRALVRTVDAHGAVVIDDVIPAHTGKGPDFRLAELRYQDYPGLYHMVEIREADWTLLPDAPPGKDSINLSLATVDALKEKGYIVGELQRVIFREAGVKETNWSATGLVVGVDGVARRWVYLHYFKEGQPSLNWLDPSFAAPQLILGDALHALDVLGARLLRLDANGFLGVEVRPGHPAWSEGHPLSLVGNQLIAGMVRKAGGFTFQELNLTVDDIAAMSQGGADLSYDFITRPAYHHALVTGDAGFLRLMLKIMAQYKVKPVSLIHALQNHDELTLELVHFMRHPDDTYTFQGREWTGAALREHIRAVMYDRLTGENAPYNLRFVENGVACTTVSVIAAALGIRDVQDLTDEQKRQIQRIHLLLVMYNAFQPGVFALSGWDLVGAVTLPPDAVAERLAADRDTRWINRGAYDLMNVNPQAAMSSARLARAQTLYGPLPEQLAQPDSFASQLQRLLAIREAYRIHESEQVAVPEVTSPGLLVMVHELPGELGTQVTALNFGPIPVQEVVALEGMAAAPVLNMLTEAAEGSLADDGRLSIQLAGYEGKSLRIGGALPG